MPSFEIAEYRVGITQHGTSSYGYIAVEPTSSFGGPIEHGVMYFFANPQSPGYQTPNTTKYVVATPPASTFADTYDVIRSEDPVYLTWGADSTTDKLYWSTVGTSSEPPGEGPRDLSP